MHRFPQHFGRYRLLRQIGAGGLGEVFLAETADEDIPKRVAVKRLIPAMARHIKVVTQFEREAEIGQRLTHKNLVHVYDSGMANDHHYIAMEFCDGGALADRLKTQPPTTDQAIELVATVCDGLQALHDADFVHCDVCPANILLGQSATDIKLSDFGVATDLKTLQGQMRGTHAYMSPEQVKGYEICQRTDVFAAGVVAWELIARRRLFHRGPSFLTFAAVVDDEVPALDDREIDTVVQRALHKDRDRRYASVAELADALRALVA